MNELGKFLMRALIFLRAQVRRHPAVPLAIAGFAAATLTVVAGGRVGTVTTVIPLTDWLGLLSQRGHRKGDSLPGALMVAGIVALVLLWFIAIRLTARLTERRLWWIAGAWTAPFVIGPPMLSNDVWTYAAQGLMVRRGLDPYTLGPSALGGVRAVAAVDPAWRSAPSPYGPIATTIQHLAIAISGGSPLGATVVFRALGVACFVAIGLLVASLAGTRRAYALSLTILNPLLLLHVVSGAHLDGLMCALLLGALLAAHQHRWLLSIVLACAAGSVKAPAFIAVLAIIAVHNQGLATPLAWRRAARDIGIAVLSILGFTALVPNGTGWVRALNTPSLGHTALAPASLLGDMYRPVVKAASFDDLATGGRITTMLAAVCIVIYLSVTAGRRPLARTIGYGLIAVGLLGPVLYPWYILWGVVCLVPTARNAKRDWIVLLSAVACVLSPPGFDANVSIYLSVLAVCIAGAVMARRAVTRVRDTAPTQETEPAPEPEPAPKPLDAELSVAG